MTPGPVLETARFTLRPLELADANEHYLGWLGGTGATYITASKTTRSLDDLRSYVAGKIDRDDILFLAIVDRASGRHVGNLKFEPVNRRQGYAVFGILVGEADFRGQGVAAEVIAESATWLRAQGITQILLGVHAENQSAVRAYEKAGFVVGATPYLPPSEGVQHMVLTL
jgi:[ribosomal protein S5]-alanine N-acetyltransferase